VTDVGLTGPDKGDGGKYLFVPPGYTGTLPVSGYFIAKPPTYGNLIFYRAFVKDDNIPAASNGVKATARIYPFSEVDSPPQQTFVGLSGKQFNTVHANTFHFYEEINEVIQHEQADAFDPEIVGVFASIGIKNGKPFAPDDRMKGILTDAVAVANATARAIVFAPRDERVKFFSDRQWNTGFVGGSYEFLNNGERMLDARTLFHYYATGITPAMAFAKPGSGSAYAYSTRDKKGEYLEGGKTIRSRCPRRSPLHSSGRLLFMTGSRAPCLKPTRNSQVSTAPKRTSRKTRMARSRCGLDRRHRQDRRPTGCKPCRARAGIRYYVCTGR
jgi:hypothetical protein